MNAQSTVRPLLTSLTRIADFDTSPFQVIPWPWDDWNTGDYVLAEVIRAGYSNRLELANGREMSPICNG